jgi:hypothetical protein
LHPASSGPEPAHRVDPGIVERAAIEA